MLKELFCKVNFGGLINQIYVSGNGVV